MKTGRTHLMDAMPVTLGQELVAAGRAQIAHGDRAARRMRCRGCAQLAQGGTAVGTGINAHPEFGARIAAALLASTPG